MNGRDGDLFLTAACIEITIFGISSFKKFIEFCTWKVLLLIGRCGKNIDDVVVVVVVSWQLVWFSSVRYTGTLPFHPSFFPLGPNSNQFSGPIISHVTYHSIF